MSPDHPLHPSILVEHLVAIDHLGMSSDCKEDAVQRLRHDSGGFGAVSSVEGKAVRAVFRECGIPFPGPDSTQV